MSAKVTDGETVSKTMKRDYRPHRHSAHGHLESINVWVNLAWKYSVN